MVMDLTEHMEINCNPIRCKTSRLEQVVVHKVEVEWSCPVPVISKLIRKLGIISEETHLINQLKIRLMEYRKQHNHTQIRW